MCCRESEEKKWEIWTFGILPGVSASVIITGMSGVFGIEEDTASIQYSSLHS